MQNASISVHNVTDITTHLYIGIILSFGMYDDNQKTCNFLFVFLQNNFCPFIALKWQITKNVQAVWC